MVQAIKFVKIVAKLFITLIIIFTFSTFLNGRSSRPKIQKFHIWIIKSEDLANPKKTLDTRFILIWSEGGTEWDILKDKQTAFEENNCAYTNCYITKNKQLLENDSRNFDAILINGKTIATKDYTLPQLRLPDQWYIFATKESSDNYPVCDGKFDNYFNFTWTYRLDSDALWTYISIFDKKDEEIGPKIDMKWSLNNIPVDAKAILTERKKTAAVWFASNCYTNSKRELLANNIKDYLRKDGLNLETVGSCGTRECPQIYDDLCVKILEDFYFYLAFENSIAEDYVTEKILRAIFHGNIPVVFGGADYSRFLPPHSYLDAGQLGAEATAATMAYLMENKTAYLEYFQWQNSYRYGTSTHSVCDLCKLVNSDETQIYSNFREWWNPKYKNACEGYHEQSVKRLNPNDRGIWNWMATRSSMPLWYKLKKSRDHRRKSRPASLIDDDYFNI